MRERKQPRKLKTLSPLPARNNSQWQAFSFSDEASHIFTFLWLGILHIYCQRLWQGLRHTHKIEHTKVQHIKFNSVTLGQQGSKTIARIGHHVETSQKYIYILSGTKENRPSSRQQEIFYAPWSLCAFVSLWQLTHFVSLILSVSSLIVSSLIVSSLILSLLSFCLFSHFVSSLGFGTMFVKLAPREGKSTLTVPLCFVGITEAPEFPQFSGLLLALLSCSYEIQWCWSGTSRC